MHNLNPSGAGVREWDQTAWDFARQDETEDRLFYETDRMVSHLDSTALATVEELVGSLVVEQRPAVLDLMASWDSHLPAGLETARVVGLGMNPRELEANPRLDERVVQDLNAEPALPFAEASFDVVLNTVSVDYLVRPVEVLAEARRVLKPGGLLLVIFSNRFFEPKVTAIWRRSGETERVVLVERWLAAAGGLEEPRLFVSKGLPRPEDDKYAHLDIPSDPVYAVFADKAGGPGRAARPLPRRASQGRGRNAKALAAQVAQTLACPYCGSRLSKWEVPQTPFTQWDVEHMWVCMNDQCPYCQGGFQEMGSQGNAGCTYRLAFNPAGQGLMPLAVASLGMLKDGLVDRI
jgi:SAM-dependent methyltransferase